MGSKVVLKNSVNAEFTIEHSGSLLGKRINATDIVVAVDEITDFPQNPLDGDVCIVRNTSRGGTFIYDATQSAVNNGGTIFNGWCRQYEGAVNVKWFGAKCDGTTDDTNAVQNASYLGDITADDGIVVLSTLNIINDLIIRGNAKFLHKAGVGNNPMIKCLTDNIIIIGEITIDGNRLNQPEQTALGFNLIWVSIGSLLMLRTTAGNTKGHLVRTGNIENFNASQFAHDCVFQECKIDQPINNISETLGGDCFRIERTHGVKFINNVVKGGYSGLRTQLYCKNLYFDGNEVSYSYNDVGITVAMSENIVIQNNNCHHNRHGYEIDAVVNCKVTKNISRNNRGNGFLSSEFGAAGYSNNTWFAGSISETNYNGYNYSNQVYSSTYVPCYDTEICYNISQDNLQADSLIGVDGTVYSYNYVDNGATKHIDYKHQLRVSGGTINKTFAIITNNTFISASEDTVVIALDSYQFTAYAKNNTYIGASKPISNFAMIGGHDYNISNKYLLDNTKRSVLLSDIADATSKTGFAITHTTSGNTTYQFTTFGSGSGEKIIRVVARVGTGTTTAYIACGLYNSAGVYVTTLLSEGADTQLTSSYKEFIIRIPSSASVGNTLKPQIRIANSGVTIYIQEINIYTAIGD